MKKIIFIIIFILLMNLVFASHIEELNKYPGLEKVLEKYLNNHNAKPVKLEYSREIILHEQDLTSLKLNIKYKKLRNKELIVYDNLPKDFINDANELILEVNTNYTILDDNIIVHYINNFNKDFTIEYLILGNHDYDANNIPEPIFFKTINLPDNRLWIASLIFLSIILIIYIIKKIKRIRLRGVLIR